MLCSVPEPALLGRLKGLERELERERELALALALELALALALALEPEPELELELEPEPEPGLGMALAPALVTEPGAEWPWAAAHGRAKAQERVTAAVLEAAPLSVPDLPALLASREYGPA